MADDGRDRGELDDLAGVGGMIAAALLGLIKWLIIYREDRMAAARRWVPVLVALMTGVFAMYLMTKGLKHLWHPPRRCSCWLIGARVLLPRHGSSRVLGRTALAEAWKTAASTSAACSRLPLIFATALLSFAHGANDVANAVGPLAAIVAAAQTGLADDGQVGLPLWVHGDRRGRHRSGAVAVRAAG